MWERFCFYGMRGILTYFMVTQLMMKDEQANLQYGATQAFVYAFTFIGGLFADKILGFRKSLFWDGILMIVGSAILAIYPKELFFLGISFTIVGTGFFKPNISTMVGTLYKKMMKEEMQVFLYSIQELILAHCWVDMHVLQ